MAVVVVNQEKNVSELATGLLLARASRTARTQTENAIRAANPGLDLDQLQPGQVLVVPDLPQARAGNVDHVENASTAVVEVLDAQLDELLVALHDAQAGQATLVDESGAMLRPALRRFARDPEAKSILDELKKNLAARRRALADTSGVDDLVAAWKEQIDTLAGLAGGGQET
jgi:hypothetical protein